MIKYKHEEKKACLFGCCNHCCCIIARNRILKYVNDRNTYQMAKVLLDRVVTSAQLKMMRVKNEPQIGIA